MTHQVTGALALALLSATPVVAQGTTRTLVAVFAHPDDETSAAPVLARYAREGVQVYLIIATDGAAGGNYTSIPRGPELARARAEEAACAATALGVKPPILLGFPDAQLGNYAEDPTRVYRLTQRIQEELQRLRPDALITWGPDGGTGHPDHRLVSSLVTQLVRAGATGAPEHLFYSAIPVEGMRAMNPGRGEPPFLVPQAKYFTTRRLVTVTDSSSEHSDRHSRQQIAQRVRDIQAHIAGTGGRELEVVGLPVSHLDFRGTDHRLIGWQIHSVFRDATPGH
jgi:N-acetyl-1-D-myo-inositol-2-amino-2-deoxy-alpha-D-glucopyranoside deacetylase